MRKIFAAVEEIFKGDYPVLLIDNAFVEKYIEVRTTRPVQFDPSQKRKNLKPCEPVTALANMKDYSTAIRAVVNFRKADMETLLPRNPFSSVKWPRGPEYEKKLRDPATLELYKALMSSWIDPNSGERLPAPVDVIDQTGRLRLLVATLFHYGPRPGSVLNLWRSDFILDVDALRAKLRQAGGAHRESWAPVFAANGAVWFDRMYSKCKFGRLVPMSAAYRQEVDLYLRRSGITDSKSPMFPRASDPTLPVSYSSIGRPRTYRSGGRLKRKGGLYVEAMLLARDYAARVGLDSDELIPIVPGQVLHAWRRTFATVLDGLGWGKRTVGDRVELDRHVNFIGNWTVTGGGIREERYVALDPQLLLAAVEFNLNPAKQM
jgi:integrase